MMDEALEAEMKKRVGFQGIGEQPGGGQRAMEGSLLRPGCLLSQNG